MSRDQSQQQRQWQQVNQPVTAKGGETFQQWAGIGRGRRSPPAFATTGRRPAVLS